MKSKIGVCMIHALTAMLLSAGIIMPILGIMDRSFLSINMLLLCTLIIAVFELVSLHKISAVIAASAAFTGIVIWIITPNGAQIISDVMIAVTLRIRGIDTAFPLIADQTMIVATCLIAVLCSFASLKRATCVPSLIMTVTTVLLIWMTDRQDLIPWIIPALIAQIMILMTSRYPETSVLRILPWSAGIVLIAFLLSGKGITIPALKTKADEFRQAVMDRLFFTEARDVFSLYSVGFSPQGPDQLGGRPDPDNNPVMKVTASQTAYLRGSIYDEYTGHGWRNTAAGRRFLWQSDRMQDERSLLFDQKLPSEEKYNTICSPETVYITMLCDSTSTLFVPQRIRELFPGTDMVPYFSNSSEIFITRNLKAGDSYSVSAPLFTSTASGIGQLIAMCETDEDAQWEHVLSAYLTLPEHLEKTVYNLAGEITADAKSPFEKAICIRNYLIRNYQYTLDVGEHPENKDFVTEFLFSTRKGYCTYFASSMTVLCRMAGLPARYIEGYRAEPNGSGETIVSGTDAHAWTEVYFKGFGWVVFDPTPGRQEQDEKENHNSSEQSNPSGTVSDPISEPTPAPTPTPEPTPETTPIPSPDESESPTPSPDKDADSTSPTPTVPGTPIPSPPEEENNTSPAHNHFSGSEEPAEDGNGFPFLLLIIPFMIVSALVIRIWLTSPRVKAERSKSEENKANIWIQEISDLLYAENLHRKNGETPIGYADRIDRTGYFTSVLRPVGEIISLLVYSKVVPEHTDTSIIRETAVNLKSEISKPARLRYWICRIFHSSKQRDWKTR